MSRYLRVVTLGLYADSLKYRAALSQFLDDELDPYICLEDAQASLPPQKNSQIDILLSHRWQPQ